MTSESGSGAGLHTHFHGPYAAGPPAAALEVHAPELDRFGWTELVRMVTVAVVLVAGIVRGLGRKLIHPRRGSILLCASEGMIDAFFVLGPTFVKVGQIMASSPGLFPEAVSRPAQKCLADVPPFPADVVRRVITEDLGRTPSQIFASFDDAPLSAASVGQVHACVLPDGREAVVKIQRPDIAHRMNTDLRIVYKLAKLLQRTDVGRRANATGQVRDLHRVTNQELNTTLEAHRQDRFRSKLHVFGDNQLVTAPEVYWDYCGPRIICMQRVRGVPMDDFAALAEMGVDARSNLRRGMKAWLEALTIHGPFHGDLHAGNIWTLDDGRNCFLDFGIMGELEPAWQEMVRDILYTFLIDQDFVRIVRGYKQLGVLDPQFGDDEALAELMANAFAPILATRMEDLQFAELFQQALEMAEQFGDISSPEELTLLGKQFLYFERYVKGIAPDYLIVTDPYLVKNIFPDEARVKMAELQALHPDDLVDPDEPVDPILLAAAQAALVAAPIQEVASAPVAATLPVLPEVDYDGPSHEFGSDDWFAAVAALVGEPPPVASPHDDVVVNLTVTGGPSGDIAAHVRGSRPGRGHAAAATATIGLPWDVARSLIVARDAGPVMQAMMSGQLTVDGDLTRLMVMQAELADPDPDQLLLAAQIKARTRL